MKNKRLTAFVVIGFIGITSMLAQIPVNFENHFVRPLGDVLRDISRQFNVKLRYGIDTTGLNLNYADSRIRAYSLEESLRNVLSPFDFAFEKQKDGSYKLTKYAYYTRSIADGEKMIFYLNTLYNDKESFERRTAIIKKQVRRVLGIDSLLEKCVDFNQKIDKKDLPKILLSKKRKYDGYSVRNIALETLPGLYVCGSIYEPLKSGKHPLLICPNGHFKDGRYREDQQLRMGVLARMGAICVDYDLIGWGENILQLGENVHRTSAAEVLQLLNGIRLLDYMVCQKNIDMLHIGVCGGSGGGTQTVLLSLLDNRYTAAEPVVSLSSHFDGGCPCESGLPILTVAGGTCNVELAAMFAPRPMRIVSDGNDWTSSMPDLEFPYLRRIYKFYGAESLIDNIHLPKESHDFGPNKRNAVYEFFIRTFSLDRSKCDEKKVTVEPYESLFSFGPNGEKLPDRAIHSYRELAKYFPDVIANLSKKESLIN